MSEMEGEIDQKTMYLEPREMYDNCVLKIEEGIVHYSVDKILGCLRDNFAKDLLETCDDFESLEDIDLLDQASMMAIEWFDYNIAGSYVGEFTPKYVYSIEEEEELEDV